MIHGWNLFTVSRMGNVFQNVCPISFHLFVKLVIFCQCYFQLLGGAVGSILWGGFCFIKWHMLQCNTCYTCYSVTPVSVCWTTGGRQLSGILELLTYTEYFLECGYCFEKYFYASSYPPIWCPQTQIVSNVCVPITNIKKKTKKIKQSVDIQSP